MLDNQVIEIAAQIMGCAPEAFTIDTGPDDVDAWDSLRHIRLLLAIEENFSVKFSEDDIVSMRSLSDILKHLEGAIERSK